MSQSRYVMRSTETQITRSAWYALYTKPHAERQVSQALAARGHETYLPMMPVWRARRRRMEEEPLFACYSFVHLDLDEVALSQVNWLPGLRNVVSLGGEPTPLPTDVIEHIQKRVRQMTGTPQNVLRAGDRVRITDGLLKDLEAVFEGHLSGFERAQILVEVMGRFTRCDVNTESLERF
ncbi:MAG: transcription termination/antitermination NusG family protein [Anaerolineae bacterium]